MKRTQASSTISPELNLKRMRASTAAGPPFSMPKTDLPDTAPENHGKEFQTQQTQKVMTIFDI